MRIALLCGGVGGSKLAVGMHHEFPDDDISVVVNTGDDLQFLGLQVSPDLDTVTYSLAGLANEVTGWGVKDDTFLALSMLERYGLETWFRIGDRDMATHLTRTDLLRRGVTLTEATRLICAKLGIRERVLPMSEDSVRTRIRIESGWVEFQEYFVRRRHEDRPLEVLHSGADAARSTPEVRDAVSTADVIVVAPSNPVVSIGPMLAIPELRDSLRDASAPAVAVSPFVGRKSVTGPADALMGAIGLEPTSAGLAELYREWVDAVVVEESDVIQAPDIESSGLRCLPTRTIMSDLAAKRRLARFAVEAVA